MKKIEIPKSKIQEMINKYPYKKDTCKELGIDIGTLNRLLKEYNLNYPRVSSQKGVSHIYQYTYIDKEWLIEHWVNSCKSVKQLSEEEHVPMSIIENRCVKYNLTKHFCYPLNKEKLFNLNDVNVWYLMGLIATDGYVPNKKNAVEISLTGDSEYKLLMDIYNYFELTSPILYNKNTTRIRFSTEGLNDFLYYNFNIPSGPKTFSVGIPSSFTNEDCAKAYFRGCLDGDGSISKQGKSFSILTASESLMKGLQHILNLYIGPEYHIRYTRNFPILSAAGSKSKKVLDWCYSLKNCFRLDRKFERYLLS